MSKSGKPMANRFISFEQVLAEEQLADPGFREDWQRTAPARALSIALLRYRADKDLTQRELAAELGVSQPRVAKLESGEHNPSIDTIINVVKRLGIEFALDVAPADCKPSFVNARALKAGAVEHDEVSLVVASSH
jgi:DNA-binding XRE family transcriptional regulator